VRIRILQAKDEDGHWYDDAYAFEDTTDHIVFRYNLTWEHIGSYYNGKLQETGVSLDEINTVIDPGDGMSWLLIEEVEDDQVESYLEALDEKCGIPKPRPIVQALPT
jgi:hypothetical protein